MPERDQLVPMAEAPERSGHSRRDFLRGSGLAAASAVVTGGASTATEAAAAEVQEVDGVRIDSGDCPIELKINGEVMSCTVEPRSTLLDTLRNRLGVTGPKRVCDRASCGACTVILDDEPVYSCTTLAIACQNHEIETLESFDPEGVPAAFVKHDGLMCGYCTPGFVTACKAWLDTHPGQDPSLEEVREALDGNICRCGTYIGVLQAALDAAKSLSKGGA